MGCVRFAFGQGSRSLAERAGEGVFDHFRVCLVGPASVLDADNEPGQGDSLLDGRFTVPIYNSTPPHKGR